jgi:translation initiation factor 3 subunit J
MSDNWDDSDDEWDKSDDELDKRLGLTKIDGDAAAPTPAFDDEDEDLTLKEKEIDEKIAHKLNKAKGSALADKKAAELAAREELELARKAMEMEAEMEANMTPEERRQAAREREEEDAKAMADDLFGGVDDPGSRGPGGGGTGGGQAMMSGDKVVMKDLKDHLRHAKKVGECIQVS